VEPWAAERTVDAGLARALIDAQFPEVAGTPILLGEGWDNVAFAVGEFVFRFPRRQSAVALIERECVILPHLQDLPLPVPAPSFVGRASERYPWPFAGHRSLPGRVACDVDDEVRARAAAPLGRFLRALHARTLEDLPGDELNRFNVAPRAVAAVKRALALAIDPAPLRPFLEIPAPSPCRPRVSCHGDLYGRNLLVDGGELSGVIDWGDLHLGDPAVDLAVAWSFLGPPARAAFREAYGAVDSETWRLARFRALDHTLACAAYAAAVGDAALAAESRRALAHVQSG
jgi:aminoglycoside phosphotransferase (APT) family kinase protein